METDVEHPPVCCWNPSMCRSEADAPPVGVALEQKGCQGSSSEGEDVVGGGGAVVVSDRHHLDLSTTRLLTRPTRRTLYHTHTLLSLIMFTNNTLTSDPVLYSVACCY